MAMVGYLKGVNNISITFIRHNKQNLLHQMMLSRVVVGTSVLPRNLVANNSSRRLLAATSVSSSSNLLDSSLSSSSSHLTSPITRCFSSKSSSSSSSSSSSGKKFRPRRWAGPNYRQRGPDPVKKPIKVKGPKEPNDVTRRIPKIDMTKIKITEDNDDDDEFGYYDSDSALFNKDKYELFDPLPSTVVQMIRENKVQNIDDIEAQLKMMDFYTSAPGSTEDLVGQRRALMMETLESEDRDKVLADIERAIEKVRIENLDLPPTELVTQQELQNEESGGFDNRIPPNQLAHGDWGEMLVRTDRVCKMWRGGRIESYRALVVGGNLNGCAGFGIGKSFEPEDAVEIASRMAKRNIFFVDRYRNRSLTRDLVGRQNSCKVVLRTTTNGLRGNPLCCEILKLFGITDVVAKAHGGRKHHNVVRATFKALMTHESLDDIAMKRGLRLVNLQKAKRLQI